jgi:hypothetical protein
LYVVCVYTSVSSRRCRQMITCFCIPLFTHSSVFTFPLMSYSENLSLSVCRDLSHSFFFGGTGIWTQGFTLAMQASHLQSILLWLLWRWGLLNYLSRLALNHDAPDLSLPSS